MSKNPRIFIIIGMILVAVFAISAVVINFSGGGNKADRIAGELNKAVGTSTPPPNVALPKNIAERIPADAFKVISSTNVEEFPEIWTKLYSQIAYQFPNLPREFNADLNITSVTYAEFPLSGEYGRFVGGALLLGHSGDEYESYDTEDWIRENTYLSPTLTAKEDLAAPPSLEAVFVHGNNIAILPNNAGSEHTMRSLMYSEDSEVPLDGGEGFLTSEDWDAVSKVEQNVHWQDLGAYYSFLTKDVAPGDMEIVQKLLDQITGILPGTRYLATVTDSNVQQWSGLFTSGGIDPTKIDLKAAEDTINSTVRVEGQSVIDEGLLIFGDVYSTANMIDGSPATYGAAVAPHVADSRKEAAVRVNEGFKSSVVTNPSMLEALFLGAMEPSLIAYEVFDVTNKDSAQLTYIPYSDLPDLDDEVEES